MRGVEQRARQLVAVPATACLDNVCRTIASERAHVAVSFQHRALFLLRPTPGATTAYRAEPKWNSTSGGSQRARFESKNPIALRRESRVMRRDDSGQAKLRVHVAQQLMERVSRGLIEIASGLIGKQ